MSNIIAYNVSVQATNLKNCQKVPQALQYLLQTPIDFETFQKFEIKKMVSRFQSDTEFGDKAQKLIRNIEKLERSQSINNVADDISEMDLGIGTSENVENEDELVDLEISKVMESDDYDEDEKISNEDLDRPVNKLYTEHCQDSPRQKAERISLWEKIQNEAKRTPSPSPNRQFSPYRKGFETPRFCPIKRQTRLSRGLLRNKNIFNLEE